ncbi:pre-rRNA-processing protein TSR1 homolog [Mytilus galloprovincialis]|uniref:pre-rRNA-processing protein TSR1 homolog n=1 Tax=Mytilus galloprovincialis TaxID=29158 RepID=UPI003F7CAD42
MAADTQQTHRPGVFKQQNKGHKHGKHRSKGSLERETKGKVNVKVLTKKKKSSLNRADRRHQASQIRKTKRDEVLAKKRGRGGQGAPPHFVVILKLHKDVDISSVLSLLKTCDEEATVNLNEQGICHISIPRFKQRVSIYTPEYGNMHALLDAVKVADSLLCLLSTDGGIDDFGDYCLTCLCAQGIPAVNFGVQGLKLIPHKKQSDVKKSIQKRIDKRFPGDKYHSIDSTQDALLMLRLITNQKLRPIFNREYRPHLLAEDIQFELPNEESELGTLKVSGYLRCQNLSVNSLVHIPGWGDFQMLQIDAAKDPYTQNQKTRGIAGQDTEMSESEGYVTVLDKANPSQQESLESENVPDPMEGEQTWPTDEELAEADKNAKKKVVKKVPKGTSEYQASWIVDSDDDNDSQLDEESDEDDDEMQGVDEVESADNESDNEEFETLTVTEADEDAQYDETMDLDEEKNMLKKIKEERLHVMFPDEVDTPMERTARERFSRYRGLKSFRTSPWDPKENLPLDYARIFQFANFRQTKKRVMNIESDGGALPGWYITVHIANVPKEFMESYKPGNPVVVFGLLKHEQKISVLNFMIKKNSFYTKPIKSKERLIFHVGYRRFSACPVFSQHTNGSKHKLDRFLPADTVTMATVYAPTMFPPASVLVFKETYSGEHELVATGSLHSVNPNRIVTKRTVLSGLPFKINKRSAVVRFMFFNREDIDWFKPVELRTKWGKRGHIKEPLGTHGHMKCVFDGQLKSQDTVLMNLYKRVFPKWTYNPHVNAPPVINEFSLDTMETEEDEEEERTAYQMFE